MTVCVAVFDKMLTTLRKNNGFPEMSIVLRVPKTTLSRMLSSTSERGRISFSNFLLTVYIICSSDCRVATATVAIEFMD